MVGLSALSNVKRGKAQKPPRMLVYGTEGIGKCLGKGTPVLMYSGQVVPVEQVVEGDVLMGPDSKPRVVRGVTSGRGELYRVTPVKGDSYVVNANHVLSLRMSRRYGGEFHRIVNMPVHEFLTQSKCFKRDAMGWRVGVEWGGSGTMPLSPYLLGCWLGDGTTDAGDITTPEPEVAEAMEQFANDHGVSVRVRAVKGTARTLAIAGERTGGVTPNPFVAVLKEIGVFGNKHIPFIYKTASRKDRLELLAGLIDTDGHYGSGCFEYTSVIEEFANDVAFLARSLGLAATVRSVQKTCTNSPTKRTGTYWRVIISGELSVVPCRVERKKAVQVARQKSALVVGIGVEPIGEGEYFGFEVDGDHLFLLGDFTVTHNSSLAACAPNPIFVTTEDGLSEIDCSQYPFANDKAESYPEFKQAVTELITEPHGFQTLVVDSADWLEQLIFDQVCKDFSVKNIEKADGGFARGYSHALTYWHEVLEMLDGARNQRGMAIILIAHAQVEKFDDPETASYDRYSPRLHKKTSGPRVNEWCDAVLFATRKLRVSSEERGYNKTRNIAAPVGRGGGDRVLKCVGSPACVAKNRYDLPAELPLSWDALAAAMAGK